MPRAESCHPYGSVVAEFIVDWFHRGSARFPLLSLTEVVVENITIIMSITNAPNTTTPVTSTRRVLIIGASRGLGLALAEEWARHDGLTATQRNSDAAGLRDLAARYSK